jgi:hypothetical protein
MTDTPTTDAAKQAATTTVSWLTLAVNALSLLEKLLPAFLVAWNNSLQQKNRELSLKLDKAKLDANVVAYKALEEKANDEKKPVDVINDFLNSRSSAKSNPKRRP